MKKKLSFILFIVLFFSLAQAHAEEITILKSLGYSNGDEPWSSVIKEGNILYGTTYYGGEYDSGTIYKLDITDPENAQHTILHSFAGGDDDGSYPEGGFLYSEGLLYGTTGSGGPDDSGVVYSIPIEGGDITIIHAFNEDDGDNPAGMITLSGSTIYGTTYTGGSGDYGVVFQVDTDGSNFTLLHEFDGDDGGYPYDAPLLSADGNTIYGTTWGDDDSNCGNVYKIDITNPAEAEFTELYAFDWDDGCYPWGGVVFSEDENTLYGSTYEGGNDDDGLVFQINIDGTGFAVLIDFDDVTGYYPYNALIRSGSKLYGTTEDSIFYIDLSLAPEDEDYFVTQHEFLGGVDDGDEPSSALLLSGGIFYGVTADGGKTDQGTVYSIPQDSVETDFTILYDFELDPSNISFPDFKMAAAGYVYSMSNRGGEYDRGTIYKMKIDGTGFAVLHDFGPEDDVTNGYMPDGNLLLSEDESTLYGMTYNGGANNKGTIFSIGTDGTGFTILHSFAGGAADGDRPIGSLIFSADETKLFGMTDYGGTDSKGVIFSFPTGGGAITILHSFVGGVDDGRRAIGDLVLDNGILYGMTPAGGDNDHGVIFKIEEDGTGFALLHEFNREVDGSSAYGSLIVSDDVLYGMTSYDSTWAGMIFSIGIDGSNFTVMHNFLSGDVENGRSPNDSLVLSGDTLYGLTERGGLNDKGTLFQIGKDGTDFEIIHSFAGGTDDGQNPVGNILIYDGAFYGMSEYGGDYNSGAIFKITLDVEEEEEEAEEEEEEEEEAEEEDNDDADDDEDDDDDSAGSSGEADIDVEIEAPGGSVGVGDEATFGVRVSNSGDGDADDVIVEIELSDNLEFVRAEREDGDTPELKTPFSRHRALHRSQKYSVKLATTEVVCTGTNPVRCNVGAVSAGDAVNLNIVTRAISEGNLVIGVQAGEETGESSSVATATATATGIDGREFDTSNAFGCNMNPYVVKNSTSPMTMVMLLFVMLTLLGLSLLKRKKVKTAILGLVLFSFLVPALAHAETNRFSMIYDVPTMGSEGLVYTLGTKVIDNNWSYAQTTDYAYKPFELVNAGVSQQISKHLLTEYYAVSWKIKSKWQLDVILPVIIYNKFSTPDVAVTNFGNNWGLGDFFVRGHYSFYNSDNQKKGLALIAYLTLPTGDENDYISDHYPRGGIKIAGDWQITDKWYSAINLGVEGREFVNLLNYSLKGRILMSTGVAYKASKNITLMTDLVSSTAINKPFTEQVTTPVDMHFGINATLNKVPLSFNVSGGFSLVRGAGMPLCRTMAGFVLSL